MAHTDNVSPMTIGDHYSADILQELRDIKGLLGAVLHKVEPPANVVRVKEPEVEIPPSILKKRK